jgi:uncharacterized SAM-binding protein YcdF (DUF218 family)
MLSLVADANALAAFLSRRDLPALPTASSTPQFSAIVVCGSAVLQAVEAAVAALQAGAAPCILFSGGVGHSTQLLYDAVAATPLAPRIALAGAPSEAAVLRDYAAALGAPAGALLVESASTNCGSNAALSRAALEAAGIPQPHCLLLLQDPTMQLRTHASFEKAYASVPGAVLRSWAPFVPRLSALPQAAGAADALALDALALEPAGAWSTERYLSLLLGEVPRLMDAPGGYGPLGSGFIAHVDVPQGIVAAHGRLAGALQALQAARAVVLGT